MSTLTNRQKIVLNFLVDYLQTNQRPPTNQEIAKGLGFKSNNASHDHLKALQRKGYIERTPKTARGIKILKESV